MTIMTAKFARYGLWSTVTALAVVIGVMLADVYSSVKASESFNGEHYVAKILQAQGDFAKLRNDLDAASAPPQQRHDQLKANLEIYHQGLQLLTSASLTSPYPSDAETLRLLTRLSGLDVELHGCISRNESLVLTRPAGIDVLVQKTESDLQSVLHASINEIASHSLLDRRQLALTLLRVAVLSTFLALAFATSTALLRRRNTQFIRRELLLGESRERLNAIIRSVPDAIVIYASNGTIIDWNDGAVECFGFNKDKVLGRSLIDLIIPQQGRSDNSLITDMLFQAGNFNIGGKRLELNVSNAEGEIFPVEITIGVSRGHGDPTFVAYIRNISDRAEAERLLKADLLKAEAANSSKARFLAVMSHEMRTPLNGVIGTLDLLAGSPLDDEQRKLVDVALTSGEELLRQISDVLDFSKMEAGKLELEIQAFDIGKCIASVVDMLGAYRAENANIISARIDPGLSGPRMGDVGRIRQILVNLGSNGMKFTQAGDVEVSVSRVNDSRVRFEVRDNGQGVSKDDLPKLFHEFTIFDTSLRRASGGTGLGLAICKRLVLAMGGQIGVESELGLGSVFWFELDLESPLQTVDGNVPVVQLGQPAKGLKVLLVEDNKTNQFVTTQMLSKFRCDVVMVENGFEALKKIATIAFDLVLMDISMPVMDGIEAIGRLRSQDGPEASMRVVALTANALTGDKERFKELGFSDYISKPVRQTDLQRILLAAHRGVQELQSVDQQNDLFNTAQIDSMVLGELMESLGSGAFEQVFASFKSDIVRNLMRMQIAAFAKDEKEMKKAAHAISGASATLGLNKLCGHASEMEQSRTILRAVDVVEKIRQLEDCFKAACRALEKISDGSHFSSNTDCINISKRQNC